MSNTPYEKAALAQAALELAPPLIRSTLLEDPEFRQEYGFIVGQAVSFGASELVIRRSEFLSVVREVLSGAPNRELSDTGDRRWTITYETESGPVPTLSASSGDRRIVLCNFAVLSSDVSVRLRAFDRMASDNALPIATQLVWRDVLSDRSIEDDEFDQLLSELQDTPRHVARVIRNQLKSGRDRVNSFVPCSHKYFERLVGRYDRSTSIIQYSKRVARPLFEELSMWRPYDGFLLSLLLSSHSAITAEIPVERLERKDLVRAFEFLDTNGDKISQLGAIEVGLRILADRPEISPHIIRLMEHIRDDSLDAVATGLKMLSALFILVDGELSRTRLMCAYPPFYRRMASISQAALIQRELAHADVAADKLCAWAVDTYGEQYYMQSLTDMRLEPRWGPDRGSAEQMKADFISRIVMAARRCEMYLKGSAIYDVALGTSSGSLASRLEPPRSYFPGALGGYVDNAMELPCGLSNRIEEQLAAREIRASSFFALINSAMLFALKADHVASAVEALKKSHHRLTNLRSRTELLGILDGLATVAAANRSKALADELRVLERRYRHTHFRIAVRDALRICLTAAASRVGLNDWREFVGDWLTELAFEDLQDDEATLFHSHLRCLCHAVPELWLSCGKADAALAGIRSR